VFGDSAIVISSTMSRKTKVTWIAVRQCGSWRVIAATFTRVQVSQLRLSGFASAAGDLRCVIFGIVPAAGRPDLEVRVDMPIFPPPHLQWSTGLRVVARGGPGVCGMRPGAADLVARQRHIRGIGKESSGHLGDSAPADLGFAAIDDDCAVFGDFEFHASVYLSANRSTALGSSCMVVFLESALPASEREPALPAIAIEATFSRVRRFSSSLDVC
jgi:hypothetical protein